MSVTNNQTISDYYDFFRDREIVLNKQNLRALKIDPRQVFLKYDGGQWPCIINSTSMLFSTIIIGTGSGVYKALNGKPNSSVSLKFCFIDSDNKALRC